MAALRDVSIILLVCESFILLLIPALIIGGSAYGVRALRLKLPPVFAQVRKYVTLVKVYVERGCAAIVAPLMAAHAFVAQVRALWRELIGFFQGEN